MQPEVQTTTHSFLEVCMGALEMADCCSRCLRSISALFSLLLLHWLTARERIDYNFAVVECKYKYKYKKDDL